MSAGDVGTVRLTVELPSGDEILAGTLENVASLTGSSQTTARFSYEAEYLRAAGAYNLSPDLRFATGIQETAVHRQMFLAFEDAGPDRWGRDLLQEAERIAARAEGRSYGRLSVFDTLRKVPDNTRQGAIRFWAAGRAVGADADPASSLETDWAAILRATENLREGRDVEESLQRLFRYGSSSPGGARPKTNVRRPDGRLQLAKLPHRSDRWNVSLWEAATLEMARTAGITVPDHELHHFDQDRSILLLDRFDRRPDGGRIGYMSARTLILLDDHDIDRGSYVRFAGMLRRESGRSDLHELFRRIVFTLLVNNADDHMRNHGLLREKNGWRLSPAFDVNPERDPSFASTPIVSGGDPQHRELRELLEQREAFELTEAQAETMVREVERATADWGAVAVGLGQDRDSLPYFAPMFEGDNREFARSL